MTRRSQRGVWSLAPWGQYSRRGQVTASCFCLIICFHFFKVILNPLFFFFSFPKEEGSPVFHADWKHRWPLKGRQTSVCERQRAFRASPGWCRSRRIPQIFGDKPGLQVLMCWVEEFFQIALGSQCLWGRDKCGSSLLCPVLPMNLRNWPGSGATLLFRSQSVSYQIQWCFSLFRVNRLENILDPFLLFLSTQTPVTLG